MKGARVLLHDDRGDIVVGWLTKLLVVLALFGLLVIDSASLTKAYFGAQGSATEAAEVARDTYAATKNVDFAYHAALLQSDYSVHELPADQFRVDPRTGTVQLVVRQEATTVLLRHVPKLRDFAVLTASGSAGPKK